MVSVVCSAGLELCQSAHEDCWLGAAVGAEDPLFGCEAWVVCQSDHPEDPWPGVSAVVGVPVTGWDACDDCQSDHPDDV